MSKKICLKIEGGKSILGLIKKSVAEDMNITIPLYERRLNYEDILNNEEIWELWLVTGNKYSIANIVEQCKKIVTSKKIDNIDIVSNTESYCTVTASIGNNDIDMFVEDVFIKTPTFEI